MKTFLQPPLLITAFILALISYLSSPIALQAKSLPIRFNPPPPPVDRGAPGNRGEGASRTPGECVSRYLPLTALVPSYEQTVSMNKGEATTITQVWGLTSAEKPSFWFYIPYKKSFIQAIEFVLQTDNNKTVYRTNVSIPQSPGIVHVPLKNTIASLEVGERYHWFFKVKVVCNPTQIGTLDYVEGWVQRVNLDVTTRQRLKGASPQEQTAIYALEGIWYDSLNNLAELRLANPHDLELTEEWKRLLKAIGLENVATQPLIP
ncbi:MAG: DUF928 domain-containing protein [Scytonema sp. PMC 1069.18]|nr:DUF928 domain-containing protein [Scytonema sp. PMC 1069.18]MEC4881808.1 DUF928 domain-containing protein [Scytonema sp. PMC 1070.18]